MTACRLQSLALAALLALACGGRSTHYESAEGAGGSGDGGSRTAGAGGKAIGVSGTGTAFGGSVGMLPTGGANGLGGATGTGGVVVTPVAGSEPTGGYTAEPLATTAMCDNSFLRVERIAESAPAFKATLDGKSVEVWQSAVEPGPPEFLVFRFGPLHVENVGFSFFVADGSFEGSLNVSFNCSVYGQLFRRTEPRQVFTLQTGSITTVTVSRDGFTGLTSATLYAAWESDSGETHVLKAEAMMRARMPDARAEQF